MGHQWRSDLVPVLHLNRQSDVAMRLGGVGSSRQYVGKVWSECNDSTKALMGVLWHDMGLRAAM